MGRLTWPSAASDVLNPPILRLDMTSASSDRWKPRPQIPKTARRWVIERRPSTWVKGLRPTRPDCDDREAEIERFGGSFQTILQVIHFRKDHGAGRASAPR